MERALLGLTSSILGLASFWLAYSSIGGWEWFLFGSIFTSALLYDKEEKNCNCKKCTCENSN